MRLSLSLVLPISGVREASAKPFLVPTPKPFLFLSLFPISGHTSTRGYPVPHPIAHIQPCPTRPSGLRTAQRYRRLLLYHPYVVVLSDVPHSHSPHIPYSPGCCTQRGKEHQGMHAPPIVCPRKRRGRRGDFFFSHRLFLLVFPVHGDLACLTQKSASLRQAQSQSSQNHRQISDPSPSPDVGSSSLVFNSPVS